MAPSGAGKTTLLRLLCGSLTPQSGSITGLPAEGIAMVFQEDRLLPGCTVLENLRLVAPERPDTELIALLGELGLSGWENARTLAATLACVDRWLGDRTFLLVTHSPQEAERLGCRITHLDALTRTGSEKQN